MTTETPEAIPNVDEVVYSGFGEEMTGTGFPPPEWMPDPEPIPEPPPDVPPPPEVNPEDEVPSGTIAEVQAWVGDDPARAQAALDAELAGQNRVTLIDWLEGVIG